MNLFTTRRMISPSEKKRGFTLMELMIGAFVLIIFFTGIYKIYQSVVRTQQIGSWMMSTTTALRNGLSLLRDETVRATIPKRISQEGITEVTGYDEEKKFKTVSGALVAGTDPAGLPTGGTLVTTFTADKVLLKFYMSKPGRMGIPGETDEPLEIMEGILKIQGGKITYERNVFVQNPTAPSKTPPKKQIVCDNPVAIRVSLLQVNSTQLSIKMRNTLYISITAQHPKFPLTKVTESIEAPFEVIPECSL